MHLNESEQNERFSETITISINNSIIFRMLKKPKTKVKIVYSVFVLCEVRGCDW